MTAFALYSEIDPFAAAWLQQLIAAGHIMPGVVDTRSLEDLTPDECRDFRQVHLCAGIGVWSYALRRAGWDDERAVWTASFPCQPFSAAGKGAGFADERHIWPSGHWLIDQCRSDVILGEQVASKDGLAWLDVVSADMEASGYAFGATDLCAAGVGASHIRQRTYWMAHTMSAGRAERRTGAGIRQIAGGGQPDGLGDDDDDARLEGLNGHGDHRYQSERVGAQSTGSDRAASSAVRPGPTNGFWRDADWLGCTDARWRPVEPGTFPLAHGAANRVGRLRGYGNAVVAPVCQTFIETVMECLPC